MSHLARAVQARAAVTVMVVPLVASVLATVLVLAPLPHVWERLLHPEASLVRTFTLAMLVVAVILCGGWTFILADYARELRGLEVVDLNAYITLRAQAQVRVVRAAACLSIAVGWLLMGLAFTRAFPMPAGLFVLAPGLMLPILVKQGAELAFSVRGRSLRTERVEQMARSIPLDCVPATAVNGPYSDVMLRRAGVDPADASVRAAISAVAPAGVTLLSAVAAASSASTA